LTRFCCWILLLCIVFAAASSVAQSRPTASQSLLVLPFENGSRAPGIEWISEAFPQVIGDRLRAPGIYVISREERLYAYDHFGIPSTLKPTRATLYKIAEQMDVEFVVMGRYNFDGQTFTATAQVLDMARLQLSPEFSASGPLPKLMDVQNALAWEVFRRLRPADAPARLTFVAASSSTRLDALENYVRALMTSSEPEKIRRLKDAVRIDPQYELAIVELGTAYFDSHDYANALLWLSKIPRNSRKSHQAEFYAGLAAFYSGDFARAEGEFFRLASEVPLTEVYNNLGAAQLRRGKRTAADYFQKALQNDSRDADYHYNLSLALFHNGEVTPALHNAREAAALHPDADIRMLIEALTSGTTYVALQRAGKAPPERLKRNFDEISFLQAQVEIENAIETRWSSEPAARHARFHLDRGHQLMTDGLLSQAERNFREAVLLEPNDPACHAALAAVLERKGDIAQSRAEAEAALKLGESAEAYVVLTRLEMRDNNLVAARSDVEHALALQPANDAAQVLQREITSRTNAVAQPRQP
jgi:tetratricopeptide (TPR) repeat protein